MNNYDDEEDEVIFEINGIEECDDELALAFLLKNEVLFCNNAKDPETICLYVNCSDVFAWACSDAECITTDEILSLYKAVKENPIWGSTIWVCLKRNEQPQKPIVINMKNDGCWTDELEALPENKVDAFIRQKNKESMYSGHYLENKKRG